MTGNSWQKVILDKSFLIDRLFGVLHHIKQYLSYLAVANFNLLWISLHINLLKYIFFWEMQNFSKVIQILNESLFSDICLESFTILNNPDILKVKKISFES